MPHRRAGLGIVRVRAFVSNYAMQAEEVTAADPNEFGSWSYPIGRHPSTRS